MNLFTKLFRSRDKQQNIYHFSGWPFVFGRSASGKKVNEFTAMQTTAVYACVRILAESIASLPLHVYEYKGQGKERVPQHPLYFLLHDSSNPEMTSFIFRETAMIHLLLWGNSYSQIIRDGMGRVVGLYPLLPNRMSVDRDEHGKIVKSIKARHAKSERLDGFVQALTAQSGSVTEFDEGLWGTLVDFMTVYSKEDISVTFKDGTEIHMG